MSWASGPELKTNVNLELMQRQIDDLNEEFRNRYPRHEDIEYDWWVNNSETPPQDIINNITK